MKTTITIVLETNRMNPIFEVSDDGKEVDVSKQVEKEMHEILKEILDPEEFEKDFTKMVFEDEKCHIDEGNSLEDYGDVNLTIKFE